MKRQIHPSLVALLVGVDLLALWGAFKATASLRIGLNWLFPRSFTHQWVEFLFPPLPLVALCWVATLYWSGSYDVFGKRSIGQVAGSTAKAVTAAMCLQIVVLFFFTRDVEYSRSLVLIFWALSLVSITATREIAFFALRRLKPGLGAEPVAVVGTGTMARILARKLKADREPRFRFAGYLADEQTTPAQSHELEAELLGHVEKAEQLINHHGLRRLFVTTPGFESRDAMELVLLCDRMDIGIERVPDLLGLIAQRIRVTELDGVPLFSFRRRSFTRWQETVKRTLDIVLSGLGLLASAPLLALIAAAIRLDSTGPLLFRQRRVGRGGKHFTLYKFRSMRDGADAQRVELDEHNESSGHLFKIKQDPRVTGVGRHLRRWSLDELPQLGNVLIGDMSLVGPRPLPTDDIEAADSPYRAWSDGRRAVRPGITGLWQVSGRSRLTFDEMARLDLYYINNWSLALDLQLLARTVPAVLSGRGAY